MSVAWLGWCLYWPFYARQQDFGAIEAEAQETYRVCLEQQGLTPADCQIDRAAYGKMFREQAAPADENVYQVFAGKRWQDALFFYAVLVLLPLAAGYILLRGLLEIVLWAGRLMTTRHMTVSKTS